MNTMIHPSKKRKALAIYFDLVLFGIIWTVISYFFFNAQSNLLFYFIVFIVLEAIVIRFKCSPGYYILSIYSSSPDLEDLKENVLIVDPDIKTSENWVTMIMGTLLINSGAKGI